MTASNAVPIWTVSRGPHANLHIDNAVDGFCSPAQLEPWLSFDAGFVALRRLASGGRLLLKAVIDVAGAGAALSATRR